MAVNGICGANGGCDSVKFGKSDHLAGPLADLYGAKLPDELTGDTLELGHKKPANE